jgi:hypothetical protein
MTRLPLAVIGAVALLAGCHRLSVPEQTPAWALADPRGDDHGDGELLLPVRGEPVRGELDLLALRAYPADGGVDLEAEFARTVRRPDGRVISSTGETQAKVAKLGFWTFNLDLYVDVDRLPGSGRSDTLPGRKALVAPETAWERVICLTPRPAEARARLTSLWVAEARRRKAEAKETLGRAEEDALERQVADELALRVFFPTRVAVSGGTVRFFVPLSFLPDGAEPSYAYLAVVTAATLDLKVDIGALFGKAPVQALFNLEISPGVQQEQLGGGRSNDPDQPPIVDALLDGPQEQALRARPAVLRGVVPAAPPP